MPDQDEQIRALADSLYHPLLSAGEQALSLGLIVRLTGPAQGEVLWRRHALEGSVVTTLHWDEIVPEFRRSLERVRLDANAQRDGVWDLSGRRYELRHDQWILQPDSGRRLAFYEPRNGWHVMRCKPDNGLSGARAEQWERGRLSGDEKAAVALIAHETGMLADVARELRDQPAAYYALEHVLMDRAGQSADPQDARRMAAALWPSDHLKTPVTRRLDVSPPGKFGTLGVPLFRALAGGAESGSAGYTAPAAVRAVALWPPCQSVDSGVVRLVASPVLARARPSATSRVAVRRGPRSSARSRRSAERSDGR